MNYLAEQDLSLAVHLDLVALFFSSFAESEGSVGSSSMIHALSEFLLKALGIDYQQYMNICFTSHKNSIIR